MSPITEIRKSDFESLGFVIELILNTCIFRENKITLEYLPLIN